MLLSADTSYDDNSVDQLLLDLFENGVYNIENFFSLNSLLNHQNSKFILENVLGDYLNGKDVLIPNLNNNIDSSLSINNKINLNKLIIFFKDKDYDRLYGFVDKLANKNIFISQNLAIKYLQIYSLYLLWDDKTSVLSILDDNLIVGSDFNDDNVVSNKMNDDNDGSSLQELKVIKTISIPVVVDLPFILHEIDHTIDLNYNSDDDFALSLLYYIKGVILNKQNNKKKAIEALTNSLKKNPYNWNAYKEMSSCIDRVEEVSILLEYISKEIQYTLLFEFFQIECWASFFQSSNRNIYIDKLTHLLSIFPTSKYLIIKNASLAFELKDLVQSEFLFDSLIQLDPYSIETMDLYSNILYVTGNLPKLKSLLTKAKIINDFSSECQTISGNFQSLIKNHENAILHFKRAIKVTSNDSQQKSKLYTLIGHEFIELGNHHAAISSYRRASSLDSRNYAAWMGFIRFQFLDCWFRYIFILSTI
ncbi:TPR-like protein [Hanseniaspora valbyensis NRRL Y-1626]|uniref:TPR-like protein n=1 Tax=Hanseniaspora valbyensis NRRL Y-1626 TaxID=766949 RepID=A0A1B7TGK2_9ASCO|nr:TPR-like protein [Hanseniaspora valbyensis NRRL Y-1626]